MSPSIRLATADDAARVLEIYCPIVEETHISFELEPPSADEIAARIRRTLELAPWLVCEDGDELLGYAYAGPYRARPAYRWSVESAVYVHPRHHRRNVGRALYESLVACLRLQGFRTLIAGIALPNDASVALHERVGFRRVGVFDRIGHKLGAWHGVGFWQLELDAGDSTRPLATIVQLSTSEPWNEAVRKGELLVRDRA